MVNRAERCSISVSVVLSLDWQKSIHCGTKIIQLGSFQSCFFFNLFLSYFRLSLGIVKIAKN